MTRVENAGTLHHDSYSKVNSCNLTAIEGAPVGDAEGWLVGFIVGFILGPDEGISLGTLLGPDEGLSDG